MTVFTPTATAVRGLDVETFARQLNGRLIQPHDDAYEEARKVWNGMINRYPAYIVQAANVADVVAGVNFARENKLPLSVRGGGHNVAGHATNDGGLVIDLARLNEVRVDPQKRIVRAGGGATIGMVDAAAQAHGLAVPLGVVSATGIAGLTLGGGYGWLSRKYGASANNLVAAEVVTADGRIVYTSENENFDLLWGLRGGGGNFGIVTEFIYRAYPIGPEVSVAFVFHEGEGEKMNEAIRYYRDFYAQAPDEVNGLVALGVIPPHEELFPAAIHGRPFALFVALYAGPADKGQAMLQPLREFGRPLADFSGVMPYVKAQQLFDADYPDGLRYYWKSLNLTRLDDEVIARVVAQARRQPSVLSTTDLWFMGGAINRFGVEDGALNGRQTAFLINPEANWEDPAGDAANIAWVRGIIADLAEFSDGGRYLNFAGFQEEGEAMMQQAFGPQYVRLAALKRKYDPTNLFRLNQNVKPG